MCIKFAQPFSFVATEKDRSNLSLENTHIRLLANCYARLASLRNIFQREIFAFLAGNRSASASKENGFALSS